MKNSKHAKILSAMLLSSYCSLAHSTDLTMTDENPPQKSFSIKDVRKRGFTFTLDTYGIIRNYLKPSELFRIPLYDRHEMGFSAIMTNQLTHGFLWGTKETPSAEETREKTKGIRDILLDKETSTFAKIIKIQQHLVENELLGKKELYSDKGKTFHKNLFSLDLPHFKDISTLALDELLELALDGFKGAEEKLLKQLVKNKSKKLPQQLLELENLGLKGASAYIAQGYAEGDFGFEKNSDKLLELANKGCSKAKAYVAEGYAEGKFGLSENFDNLAKLAAKGWEEAEILTVQMLLTKMPSIKSLSKEASDYLTRENQRFEEAQRLAETGMLSIFLGEKNRYLWKLIDLGHNKNCQKAQDLAIEVYRTGRESYALYSPHRSVRQQMLLALANNGWEEAQKHIVEGYLSKKNHKKVKELAQKGWKSAQKFFLKKRTDSQLAKLAFKGRVAAQEQLVERYYGMGHHGYAMLLEHYHQQRNLALAKEEAAKSQKAKADTSKKS